MMLKPENHELRTKADAIVQLFAQFNRGDWIPWNVIETHIGVTRLDRDFWPIMHKAKRRIGKERGICMMYDIKKNDEWHGAYMPTVNEQLMLPFERRMRRATRQCTYAKREMGYLPDSELTVAQRVAKYQRIEKANDARRMAMRSKRSGLALTRQKHKDVPIRSGK